MVSHNKRLQNQILLPYQISSSSIAPPPNFKLNSYQRSLIFVSISQSSWQGSIGFNRIYAPRRNKLYGFRICLNARVTVFKKRIKSISAIQVAKEQLTRHAKRGLNTIVKLDCGRIEENSEVNFRFRPKSIQKSSKNFQYEHKVGVKIVTKMLL